MYLEYLYTFFTSWRHSTLIHLLSAAIAALFLWQKQIEAAEGLVEPEVVERCRDNYNMELDQQLQEAIRSWLSQTDFHWRLEVTLKMQRWILGDSHPNK